jgi:hypothetical protein
MTVQSVNSLIKEARQWCDDYVEYNRAKGIHVDPDLSGMCAIATSYLSQRFNEYGVEYKIGIYDTSDFGHCFVVYDNHLIDLTATQFNTKQYQKYQKIEIRKLSNLDIEKFPFWEITHKVNNRHELLTYQKNKGWLQEHTVESLYETLGQDFFNKNLNGNIVKNKIQLSKGNKINL